MKTLILEAIGMEASDLHLTADTVPFVRVHGEIILMDESPLSSEKTKALIYEIMSEEQIRQFEKNMELCFSLTIPNLGYFRVTVYYQQGQVEAAIRLGMSEIKPLNELGLPPVLEELTRKPTGLILITGPTGHGKTTTLNTLVDVINRDRRCKIIMVEDPIEYLHENIQSIVIQQEVHTDTHSFHSAIIHILRQDPDVIVVGEMRDLETIQAALTAAETGHLVIATIHSNDCPQTINRIVDVFPEDQQPQIRYQLAFVLRGIVSQRLLPRADRKGRVLACSMLVANQAVHHLIGENKINQLVNVLMGGKREGMVLMDTVIKELYEKAIISYETALDNIYDPKKLHMESSSELPV